MTVLQLHVCGAARFATTVVGLLPAKLLALVQATLQALFEPQFLAWVQVAIQALLEPQLRALVEANIFAALLEPQLLAAVQGGLRSLSPWRDTGTRVRTLSVGIYWRFID